MRKLYYKLVRDRIPEVIEEAGKEFSVSRADSSHLRDYTMKKLIEEVSEFIEEPCVEEAADILEILDFICKREGITQTEIEAARISKYIRRGSFQEGYILEWVKE
jgi:predicted house-cleaning noncanonical NTP pyrophosphatase (MazG superfamily)